MAKMKTPAKSKSGNPASIDARKEVLDNYPKVPYRKCFICGDKLEEQHRKGMKLCYGCRLDGLLPADYQKREEYKQVPPEIGKHKNATIRPRTGIDILDRPSGVKSEDIENLHTVRHLEGIAKQEAIKGLSNGQYFHKEL